MVKTIHQIGTDQPACTVDGSGESSPKRSRTRAGRRESDTVWAVSDGYERNQNCNHAIDAAVAEMALRQQRPAVMLASDVDDMTKLRGGRVRLVPV